MRWRSKNTLSDAISHTILFPIFLDVRFLSIYAVCENARNTVVSQHILHLFVTTFSLIESWRHSNSKFSWISNRFLYLTSNFADRTHIPFAHSYLGSYNIQFAYDLKWWQWRQQQHSFIEKLECNLTIARCVQTDDLSERTLFVVRDTFVNVKPISTVPFCLKNRANLVLYTFVVAYLIFFIFCVLLVEAISCDFLFDYCSLSLYSWYSSLKWCAHQTHLLFASIPIGNCYF